MHKKGHKGASDTNNYPFTPKTHNNPMQIFTAKELKELRSQKKQKTQKQRCAFIHVYNVSYN